MEPAAILPRPVELALCHNCGQLSLHLYLAAGFTRSALVGHCPECDAGHCPHCHRHTLTLGHACFDEFCTECGASLALIAASS